MKRCTVTLMNAKTQVLMLEEVLVDNSSDKYDVCSHFEGRISDGWFVTGVEVKDSNIEVFILE